MTYEMTGTIKKIGDLQTFPSGFEKRELLLNDEDPRFPQDIAFSFTRDRTKLLDQFAEGERAKVSFDIRCREFNDRHYIDLNAWRIERPADASPAAGIVHSAAAYGTPCVTVTGGREPVALTAYPSARHVATTCAGRMAYGAQRGCMHFVADASNASCERAVLVGGRWYPSCMAEIDPATILSNIRGLLGTS